MKRFIQSILAFVTVLFLTAALAGSALAAPDVPLKGSVDAVETLTIDFPTMLVDTTGGGQATHLGRYTVTWEFTVNLLNGVGIGSAHFVAANGDSFSTTSLGQGTPQETPNINIVVEQHTITGGTGRFAGATGSFTLTRVVDTNTGVTSGSFEGHIVLR